ncbi:hypothetical protein PIROE2DRAFT_7059 [Piromyces sp. E2]|nr:hypothetical protein PIROE2DRAFT_7059 [Piromyces sp. E2]|eukprot:OUM65897.1 hypothetical protein PIROE2DRAFT_7059 [Piromyces sp. E2]
MNKFIVSLINIIITVKFIYGQNSYNECEPVNKLMHKEGSFDCCSDKKRIVCNNGHVTELWLSNLNLGGTIPPELGKLPFLSFM